MADNESSVSEDSGLLELDYSADNESSIDEDPDSTSVIEELRSAFSDSSSDESFVKAAGNRTCSPSTLR